MWVVEEGEGEGMGVWRGCLSVRAGGRECVNVCGPVGGCVWRCWGWASVAAVVGLGA